MTCWIASKSPYGRNETLSWIGGFEERRQGPAESFDEFYISLRCLADTLDICGTCFNGRMATRVLTVVIHL